MNGIDATEIITDSLQDTKVLIFSMHDSPEFVTSSIQAGLLAIFLKTPRQRRCITLLKR
ncbi:hypothetical protein P4S73_04200 [Paraglaciecola sp. Hal342]